MKTTVLGVRGFVAVAVLSFLSVGTQIPSAVAAQRVALVYKGPGSCGGKDDCSGAAAEIAVKAGLAIRYVSSRTLTPEVFRDAAVWIQPGGNAIEVSQTLGHKKIGLIREFVRAGGGYVGFCAGAFFADRTVDDPETIEGLGLIPISTGDYGGDKGKDGTIIQVNWKNTIRTVFFNGGAYFKMPIDHPTIRATSVYENGQVAAVETQFGAGRVALSGFHPEATQYWKDYAVGQDTDGSDQDIAEDMLSWALRER